MFKITEFNYDLAEGDILVTKNTIPVLFITTNWEGYSKVFTENIFDELFGTYWVDDFNNRLDFEFMKELQVMRIDGYKVHVMGA